MFRRSPIARLITAGILALFGLIFLGVAWFTSSTARAVMVDGGTAQGEVVEVTRSVSRRTGRPDSITFCPRVRFSTGTRTETIQGVCTNPADFKVGDKVEVRYERANPANAAINRFSDLYLFPLMFSAFGGIALLLGLLIGIRALFGVLRAGSALAAWAATRRD